MKDNVDDRFGSLRLRSEIWSIAWSPDARFVVSCSEDQTARIFSVAPLTLASILPGHTLAATSVDWQVMASGQQVLATCSDDRTIRIYDGVTFKLKAILNTHELHGWHTITYMALEQGGHRCVCVTQNGFLVAFVLAPVPRRVFKARIQSGSVEGLVWGSRSGILASVSAANTVVLCRLR